jgi:hypothetical protein
LFIDADRLDDIGCQAILVQNFEMPQRGDYKGRGPSRLGARFNSTIALVIYGLLSCGGFVLDQLGTCAWTSPNRFDISSSIPVTIKCAAPRQILILRRYHGELELKRAAAPSSRDARSDLRHQVVRSGRSDELVDAEKVAAALRDAIALER